MSILDDLYAVMLAEVGTAQAVPDLLKKYLTALGYTQSTVIGQMSAFSEDNGMSITHAINYIANGSAGPVATAPDAPTIGTATRGNTQASVTFTPPVDDGGSAITGYTMTSSPGGLTATGASSPLVVTGLTNGVSYTFAVTATNAIGTSDASAASNAVTPATVPGAPTIGTATGGDAQASITFSAPASNGGEAITGYTLTSSPGGLTGTGASSPIVVTGLTNGVEYTFTATATNAIGTGSASSASNSVTPAAANLLSNPGFDTDTVWSKQTGWSISGGKAVKVAGSGGNVSQPIAFVAAGTYEVTYTVVSISVSTVNCRFITGDTTVQGTNRSAAGTYTQQLVAGTHTVFAINAAATTNCEIDNVILTRIS